MLLLLGDRGDDLEHVAEAALAQVLPDEQLVLGELGDFPPLVLVDGGQVVPEQLGDVLPRPDRREVGHLRLGRAIPQLLEDLLRGHLVVELVLLERLVVVVALGHGGEAGPAVGTAARARAYGRERVAEPGKAVVVAGGVA